MKAIRWKMKGVKEDGAGYITKPFKPEEILARVRTHLTLRELAANLEQKVMERIEEFMIANGRLERGLPSASEGSNHGGPLQIARDKIGGQARHIVIFSGKSTVRREFMETAQSLCFNSVLPAVCGRDCPQESQCELTCVMGRKMKPLAIERLERFACNYSLFEEELPVPETELANAEMVAVLGEWKKAILAIHAYLKNGRLSKIWPDLLVGNTIISS